MRKTKEAVPFYALNFFIFSIFAVFSNYLVAYLGSIGLSASEIGVVTTIGYVLIVFLQVFMGTIADKSKNKVRVFQIELISMLVFAILASQSRSYMSLIVTISVVSFLTTIVVTMCETLTVSESENLGHSYGHMRLAGAIGYMVCSLLAGGFAQTNAASIFIMLGVLLLAILIVSLFLPKIPGEVKKENKVSIFKIINNREIILVLILIFALGICSNFFINYAVLYYESIGIGLSTMGVLFFVGAAFEIPFLFFLEKLIKRFGAKNLLLTAAVLSLIRWVVMFFATHPAVGIFSQILHGYTYSLGLISGIKYINEKLPNEFSARGQMIVSLSMNGFSRIISNFFGGYIIDYFGSVRSVLIYLAVILAVAITGFVIFSPKDNLKAEEVRL